MSPTKHSISTGHALKFACSLALVMLAEVHLAAADEAVKLFELSRVQLHDGPFLNAARLNRDQLLLYNPDRLLAPFRAEAGLEPKAKRYPNWESMGLDGHTAGHYLSALANTSAALNDEVCRKRMDFMVAELAKCQETHGNGYVGGVPRSKELWDQVAAGEIGVHSFSLQDRWVPLYNLHKTFAGLRDAYSVGGNSQAKDVLVKLADWAAALVVGLSDEQLQQILQSEHGGLNEVLADVAVITGDDKYLNLAERFSHRAILDPLADGQDRLTGLHANTQVPKVIGFERIAQLRPRDRYHRAATYFWENVVGSRSLAFGGNSVSEHFQSPSQSLRWIEHREGPETCNTYNMLRLTELLFSAQPEARFADFYERALFNHILSTQHPQHGGYVYFTPARPRHYRVYSEVGKAFWCCVGSGMENHSKYGQFIYAHRDSALLVNLFIASKLSWEEQGVEIKQETNFPDEPRTRLTCSLDKPKKFAIHIRHPIWVNSKQLRITINGEAWPTASVPGSYAIVDRVWSDGDRIEVELPMQTTVESLPNLDDYVALVHGPIVLAAKTGAEDLNGLVADAGRMDHVASGPLQSLNEAPMLVAARKDLPELVQPVEGESLTFTISSAIRPDSFDSLKIIPFFRLHDARYMIYWRLVSPEAYGETIAAMRATDQSRLALDIATVDRVATGEQQPETEHNFRGDQTSTGIWQDRRFRHAEGWFSYDLRAGEQKNLTLRVTYFGSDRREFDILVNDQTLTEVRLQAPRPGEFVDKDYQIPVELIDAARDGKLTVKFVAQPGSMAGGIFDVRLLKSDNTPNNEQ